MNILQAIQENNLVSLFLFAPAANGGNAVAQNKKYFGYFLVEILDYLCYNKNKKLVRYIMDKARIKENLNQVTVNRDALNQLAKDRMDFAFDSIYFRYAIVRDELAQMKAHYESHDWHKEKTHANTDKMHFYNTLEQWTQAHKEWDE